MVNVKTGRALEIENLGRVPEPIVGQFRQFLAGLSGLADSRAQRDPSRSGFYFLKDDERVFYVAVTPFSGRVLLLASWPRETRATLECAAD